MIETILKNYRSFVLHNDRLYDKDRGFRSAVSIFPLLDAAHQHDPKTYTKEHIERAKKRIATNSKRNIFLKFFNYIYLCFYGLLFYIFASSKPTTLFACDLDFTIEEMAKVSRRKNVLNFPTFRPGAFFTSSICLSAQGHVTMPTLASTLYVVELYLLRFLLTCFRVDEIVLRNSSVTGGFLVADAARRSAISINIVSHGYLLDFLFLTILPCLADRYVFWTRGQETLFKKVFSEAHELKLTSCQLDNLDRCIISNAQSLEIINNKKYDNIALLATQFYFDYDIEIIDNERYFSVLNKLGSKVTFYLHPADRSKEVRDKIKHFLPDAIFANVGDNFLDSDLLIASSLSMLFDNDVKTFSGTVLLHPYDFSNLLNKSFIDITLQLEGAISSD